MVRITLCIKLNCFKNQFQKPMSFLFFVLCVGDHSMTQTSSNGRSHAKLPAVKTQVDSNVSSVGGNAVSQNENPVKEFPNSVSPVTKIINMTDDEAVVKPMHTPERLPLHPSNQPLPSRSTSKVSDSASIINTNDLF